MDPWPWVPPCCAPGRDPKWLDADDGWVKGCKCNVIMNCSALLASHKPPSHGRCTDDDQRALHLTAQRKLFGESANRCKSFAIRLERGTFHFAPSTTGGSTLPSAATEVSALFQQSSPKWVGFLAHSGFRSHSIRAAQFESGSPAPTSPPTAPLEDQQLVDFLTCLLGSAPNERSGGIVPPPAQAAAQLGLRTTQ